MPSRDSSRRDFLSGRAIVRSARNVVDRALDGDGDQQTGQQGSLESAAVEPSASGRSQASYLLQYATRAMACEFEVTVPAAGDSPASADTPTADELAEHDGPGDTDPPVFAALQLVDELEQQLTVYQPDSELSRINQQAAQGPVVVEPRLFALLQQCHDLWKETGGAFDITSTPLTRAWGFFRREGKLPDAAALEDARARIGFQHVVLDVETNSVRFAKPGIELNLGAIGKGYALDRCGELMRERGADCFLWHAGQSSVLAGGDQPGQKNGSGWAVNIGNPLRPGKSLGTLWVKDAGLGTSGSSQQFFRQGGKRYGHVIDPRTGEPSSHVLSVTVIAPTAAAADALATAFYLLGPERATGYCRAHKDCGFVMLARQDAAGPVSLYTAGLGDEQLRLESSGFLQA